MYRIETHLHTTYISRCGWLGAEAIMKYYTACGYDAICVTDHYNRECFDYAEIDLTTPGSKTQAFLQGYHRLKKVSEKYNIRVYAGAELRFDESDNDYLLYGFHDALLADPDRVMREGLAAFAPQYRADGALLVQAHPFRKKCTPAPAEYLDGIEVLNREELGLDKEKGEDIYGMRLRFSGNDTVLLPLTLTWDHITFNCSES